MFKNWIRLGIVGVFVAWLTAAPTHAAIVVVADYTMGDGGTSVLSDSSGNNRNLNTNAGSVAATTAGGLTYASFDGTSQGIQGTAVGLPGTTNNWGWDMVVRIDGVPATNPAASTAGYLVTGGVATGNFGAFLLTAKTGVTHIGFGYTNQWAGTAVADVTDFNGSSLIGQWISLAYVDTGTTHSFYVNGVLVATVTGKAAGAMPHNLVSFGYSTDGSRAADVDIDESRFFTFTAGQFTASDLLTVPAPAALPGGLVLMGAAALRRRRR